MGWRERGSNVSCKSGTNPGPCKQASKSLQNCRAAGALKRGRPVLSGFDRPAVKLTFGEDAGTDGFVS